jgi:hypothetical protein
VIVRWRAAVSGWIWDRTTGHAVKGVMRGFPATGCCERPNRRWARTPCVGVSGCRPRARLTCGLRAPSIVVQASRSSRPRTCATSCTCGTRRPPTKDRQRLAVGRSAECDVCLTSDPEVSRLHAELERVGSQRLIAHNGLSLNGTLVGPDGVLARERLRDSDPLRCPPLRSQPLADALGAPRPGIQAARRT